ncbi:uncharacterized protein LOC128260675 isoform X2 [Drosophila gunungcola]|uniref:uncharacterized protein LOC128260675 isoform X2 n=1 Tax=Drosophila gunungcola TaxID=103775 RepID=UPI0022E8BE40|nr:uncharacterized protein LOC128260675 isoform X2 [Drosophila gunungcola]
MLKNEVSQRNRYARARYHLMQMERKNLANDQAQKEDTSKPSDLTGKSKLHAVLALQKPWDLANLDSEFSIHSKSHNNCWERSKPADFTSKDSCDQEKPINQLVAGDQGQKEVTPEPSAVSGKSKLLAVFALRKPCDQAKLDSEYSNNPKSHQNCRENPKPAPLTSKEACERKNPFIQVVAGDQAQKKVINPVTSKPSDLAGKSKFHAVLALQKPWDLAKLDSEFSIHPISHHSCWERPKLAPLTSKEACGQEKPISQPDYHDDFPSCVPSHASSSSSHVKSQEDNKTKGISHLSQIKLLAGPGPDKQDAQVAPPKTELCTRAIQLVPGGKEEYMKQWLISAAGLPTNQSPKEPVEQEAIELPCSKSLQESLAPDSDEEELAETNPFAKDTTDPQALPVDNPEAEEPNDFMQRLQFRAAIPESCLTDAVFMVDKPRDAVALGKELPTLRLQDNCREQDQIMISVCKIYSPFQFWFHFVNGFQDTNMLAELNRNINHHYNHERMESYSNPLSTYFLKAGYICAANHRAGWRRARILTTPPKDADWVFIYYVDYASAAKVSPNDLRFLPDWFTDWPALAVRGTLSYVHPLGLHWPPDSTHQFRRLVLKRELHAQVTEMDADAGILFLRLSETKTFDQSINKKLVIANLAGKSDHYSRELIEYNCGRRLRYLRERLPSFEILESRVIPLRDEEFETEFDDIIYSPSFYKDFQLPELSNPFRSGLLEALAAWMPAYRKEQEHWSQIYRKANQKVREAQHRAVLGRQEIAQDEEIEEDQQNELEPMDPGKQNEPNEQKEDLEQKKELK